MTTDTMPPADETSAGLGYVHEIQKKIIEVAPAVTVVDDPYSARLRCDHPAGIDGAELGSLLWDRADKRGRDRIVVFADTDTSTGLIDEGFVPEAIMPGFYEGEEDCVVLAGFGSADRTGLAHPREVAHVRSLLETPRPKRPRPDIETQLAVPEDAEDIAQLLDETFDDYPTPSHDPAYVRRQIEQGTPFRFVTDGDRMVSCASADLVEAAKNAELTDCATRPSHRGQGLMRAILEDLMGDLQKMNYTGAFTLARARIPGVNLAFARLGFTLHGCMAQSCRIGDGIEDMNVWSRSLVTTQ